MREVVLDTETTGLNPAEGHRVVEIGAVELIDETLTGKAFHVLINPEREVPEDAIRVHGHTEAILRDRPIFAHVADDFLAFVGDAKLIIHNAEFDIAFVNAELTRIGRQPISMDRVVDTLVLARRKHPGQANSLDALCDRYQIDRSRRTRHGALLDAEILVEIYYELMGGRQRLLALGEAGDSFAPQSLLASFLPVWPRRPRESKILPEEARDHAEHIRGLGNWMIWMRYLAGKAAVAGADGV